jgi:hypothetical protein
MRSTQHDTKNAAIGGYSWVLKEESGERNEIRSICRLVERRRVWTGGIK